MLVWKNRKGSLHLPQIICIVFFNLFILQSVFAEDCEDSLRLLPLEKRLEFVQENAQLLAGIRESIIQIRYRELENGILKENQNDSEDSTYKPMTTAPKIGDRIGPYKVTEYLGKGAYGLAYEVEDPIGRPFTLKLYFFSNFFGLLHESGAEAMAFDLQKFALAAKHLPTLEVHEVEPDFYNYIVFQYRKLLPFRLLEGFFQKHPELLDLYVYEKLYEDVHKKFGIELHEFGVDLKTGEIVLYDPH